MIAAKWTRHWPRSKENWNFSPSPNTVLLCCSDKYLHPLNSLCIKTNTSALTYAAVTVEFSTTYETSRNGSTMEKPMNIQRKTEYSAPTLKSTTRECSCCNVLDGNKLWDVWFCVQASQMDFIIIINIIMNINPTLKSFQTGNLQGSKEPPAWKLMHKLLSLELMSPPTLMHCLAY